MKMSVKPLLNVTPQSRRLHREAQPAHSAAPQVKMTVRFRFLVDRTCCRRRVEMRSNVRDLLPEEGRAPTVIMMMIVTMGMQAGILESLASSDVRL